VIGKQATVLRSDQSVSLELEVLGGKAFNLFQMAKLKGVQVPPFFVVSSVLYRKVLETLEGKKVQQKMKKLFDLDLESIEKEAQIIRRFFLRAPIEKEEEKKIVQAYQWLGREVPVAVRSSATCEDLPEASFAGQQDTYLNIRGEKAVLRAIKQCLASLFTVRAIVYRNEKKIDHLKAALCVVVQQMVESKVSGVSFSIEPTTGFDKVVRVDASYGLGEAIVQGLVTPDTFLIAKKGYVVQKELGQKEIEMVYAKDGVKKLTVKKNRALQWSLRDSQALELAEQIKLMEKYYGHYVDVEYAVDNQEHVWIVQVRPETKWQVLRRENPHLIVIRKARIADKVKEKPVVVGLGVSPGAASGRAVFLDEGESLLKVKPGDIMMAKRTDPDLVPAMQISGGVVTASGGRTSHAAIVSRELGIPAVVGTQALGALKKLEGRTVTIDGGEGVVYDKAFKLINDAKDIDTAKLPKTRTRVGLILADINQAFKLSRLAENDFEVGLLRAEFMLGQIAVHPRALDDYDNGQLKTKSREVYEEVGKLLKQKGFKNGKQYFVETLASGLGCFALAFENRKIVYRTTDYKTNEYKNQLIGGALYEPDEDNPMIGDRGTGRYIRGDNSKYLGWEMEAVKIARSRYGGKNLQIMLPFIRTLYEAQKGIEIIRRYIKEKDIKVIAMAEIPSNALIANQFLQLFDGFSIGSNDMTQLSLGTDRDNERLQKTYDEHDPAAIKAFLTAIFAGLKQGKSVGFCGQGVSDSVIIAGLVSIAGITSVSVVPDRYLQTKELISRLEKQKIKVKDLGQWLKQQFIKKQKQAKTVMEKDKAKIYAQLNWEQVVNSAMKLVGFDHYDQLQAIIDKR